ncbi:Myb-binding protein 1A, partial [Linum perenne]
LNPKFFIYLPKLKKSHISIPSAVVTLISLYCCLLQTQWLTMGSNKRSSNSVEKAEESVEGEIQLANPIKKKLKKDHKTKGIGNVDATAVSEVKPMERKKKRKESDKARHKKNEQEKPKQMDVDETDRGEMVASSSKGLPAFHIDVFKDLASADASVREAGVERLVTELQKVQNAYEGNKELYESGLKLEADKDDGLNDTAPSVRYAIRRLIRGASSPRECARQGYALGLTLLVCTIPSIKVDSMLKLILEILEVSASMKGQEAKDCLLGRLFSYGALARSGRLNELCISDPNTPVIKEFVSVLLTLATKKSYLPEPVVTVILNLAEKLQVEHVLNHVLEAPGFSEWFSDAVDTGNPDALLLALKLREKVSVDTLKFGKVLPYPFSPSSFFSSEHLNLLNNCWKNSTSCQPRVHSVWPVLVNMLLPVMISQAEDVVSASNSLKKNKRNKRSSSSDEEVEKNVQNFCEVIIEGALLPSSHDRKHLALNILLLLLPRLPASLVPVVLSDKLVQGLMDILSTKDSWLYKVAQHFIKELSDWVGNDDVRRVAVIVALQKHSNGRFDSITKTKTVKALLAEFKTESGCLLFIQNLANLFVDESNASDEPSDQSQTTDDNSEMGSLEDKDSGVLGNSDSLKSWIVESLPSILKFLKLDPEEKLRVQKEIFKFLAVQGLFSSSLGSEVTSFELQEKFTWPKAATSSAICRICIEQIQSLLASAQKMESSPALLNGSETSDLGSFFMQFLSTLRSIPTVSLFRILNDEDEKAYQKLLVTEASLRKQERKDTSENVIYKYHALRYLLIQLLLQVLLRPGEFTEAVSEITICCKKAFQLPDIPDQEEDESDGDIEWMDVLVDTLLSLLPQSSAPLRTSIEQVFKCFSSEVTVDGLLQMLRIIKRDLKPARHREADSENDDDDDDDLLDIEEDEDDEIDEAQTGESEDQTDDSEAVVEAGGDAKESSDDSDDESDEGMDDEEMFRMDTYLAQIFKEKKNQTGSETAQSQLVLFKLRVLSLLEIYLHTNPGSSHVVTIYSYLAKAFVNPQTTEVSEQLGQRIWGILNKKILKAKDFPKGADVNHSMLVSLLERNLKLASRPFKKKKSAADQSKKKQASAQKRHKMIASLSQDSTFWILKIIDASKFSGEELESVFGSLKNMLTGFFDSKKCPIKSGFVKELFKRRPWIGHHLFEFLLDKCCSSKLEFRRVEALDLVLEVLKSMVPGKKALRSRLQKLSELVKELVTNMPEKQSRHADVRKFCGKVFQIISVNELAKSFLKLIDKDAQTSCELRLGQVFLNFKNGEQQK